MTDSQQSRLNTEPLFIVGSCYADGLKWGLISGSLYAGVLGLLSGRNPLTGALLGLFLGGMAGFLIGIGVGLVGGLILAAWLNSRLSPLRRRWPPRHVVPWCMVAVAFGLELLVLVLNGYHFTEAPMIVDFYTTPSPMVIVLIGAWVSGRKLASNMSA